VKGKWTLLGSILAVLLLALAVGLARAQGPQPPGRGVPPQGGVGIQALMGIAFTYQGQLKKGGNPVNGICDFQFSLYGADSGGSPISVQTTTGITVTNGLFTVPLDFGAGTFQGDARWLQVAVKCAGDASYIPLAPRQALTAAPYALSLRPGAQVVGLVTADPYTVIYARNTAASGLTYGVVGESASTSGRGVYGEASAASGYTYGVYGRSYSTDGWGVAGWASANSGANRGVYGQSNSPAGYGGYFLNNSADGVALYAVGSGSTRDKATLRVENTEADRGMAAYLTNSSNYATAHFANGGSGEVLYLQNGGTDVNGTGGGDFITAVNNPEGDIQFRVTTSGQGRSDVGWTTPAEDFAEMLPAVPGLEPGDVLVVGADGKLARSTQAYQPTVVGVYSTRPGFVGGQPVEGELEGHIPLAVVGVVPVKASAENGPICPGDLLVASATPGHAMKAGPNPPQGTVIGKALEGLEEGTGVIQMLVVLQ